MGEVGAGVGWMACVLAGIEAAGGATVGEAEAVLATLGASAALLVVGAKEVGVESVEFAKTSPEASIARTMAAFTFI